MTTTFKLDPEGDAQLLRALAAGFSRFGNAAADAISAIAPVNTGRYAGTIQETTFLEGQVYSGNGVRGRGIQSKAQIWTVIYTDSPLGHLLELGTRERTVAKRGPGLMVWPPDKYSPSGGAARVVHQPAMARRPHFWPGFASVIPRAGELVGFGARVKRLRVNTRFA